MDTWIFYGSAVAAGFVLIGLVVYSYVRPRPEHRPSVTALLGMLTSCSSNVTAVNIDYGFGAAYVATLINRL